MHAPDSYAKIILRKKKTLSTYSLEEKNPAFLDSLVVSLLGVESPLLVPQRSVERANGSAQSCG